MVNAITNIIGGTPEDNVMRHQLLFTSAILFLFAATVSSCTAQPVVVHDPAPSAMVVSAQDGGGTVVVVHKRPPAPRREVIGRRPSVRHVWVGGHWTWRKGSYVWTKGRYVQAPRHGARWVAGHWKRHHGGWIWVAGYWRY
jgi:hypothetical protein